VTALGTPGNEKAVAVGLPAALVRRAGSRLLGTSTTLAIGIFLVAVVAAAGLLHAHLGLPDPNAQDLNHPLQAPSASHLFGTDDVGRDVLSRTVAAALLDVRVAITLTALSLSIGLIFGVVSGFAGGAVDAVVMRLADVALAFPFLVLVIAVTAVFGPGLTGIYVGVPLVGWALYARLTRAEVLSVRERTYIAAARSLGYSRLRILMRHVLPNVWRPAFVYSASDLVANILALGALSYLGLGVQPPTPEWGAIIQSGQAYIFTAWWITALPGLVVVVAGLGFSLIGDAVGERLGSTA
jgi:peptide/nickel transport system permease protein